MAQTLNRISEGCYVGALLCFLAGIVFFFVFHIKATWLELKGKGSTVVRAKTGAEAWAHTMDMEEKEQTSLINPVGYEQFVVTKKILYVHSKEKI